MHFLVENGADIFAKDNIGRSALSEVIYIDEQGRLLTNNDLFGLFLESIGSADVNDLFNDVDADNIAKSKGVIAERLRNLGLKPRFDDQGYIS